jgi:hypothetical protein
MRQIVLILLAATCLWALSTGAGYADDTLYLQTLPSTTFAGDYVGPVVGNLNGGPQLGFVCDDFSAITYVPSSFHVRVGTLADFAEAKFGWQPDALFKYQEVAWLVGQMKSNPSQVGPIQFAAWHIFTPSTPSVPGEEAWLAAAASIHPADWDFSSVRIYTPTDTNNQEFASGWATSVTEPATILLLGSGLAGLALFSERRRRKTA